MKTTLLTISALAALAAQPLRAEEEKGKSIAADKLPAGAAAAIKKWAGDAKLSSIIVENEGGLTVYEAAIEGPHGAKREVSVTASGVVWSTEEVIALDKAPEAVRAAAAKELGDGKLVTCEKIISGETTVYEITYTRGGKEHEAEFNADGSELPEAEGEEDGEEKDEPKAEGKHEGKKKAAKEEEEEDDDDEKEEKAEKKHEGKGKKGAKEEDDDDDDDDDDEKEEKKGHDDEKEEHGDKK